MHVVAKVALAIWFGLVSGALSAFVLAWFDAGREHAEYTEREAVAARNGIAGAVFFVVLTISLFIL